MEGKMVRHNSFVFLVVLTLFFVGCAPLFPIHHQSRIYEKDIKKIELGSTKAKVYDLLGKPNFLINDRYCVYEVCGWYGGFVAPYVAGDFGGEKYRILLEFNENDTLINYKMEKGVVNTGPVYFYNKKVTISPNGKTLAVLSNENMVWLYNLETKEKVKYGREYFTATPEFSPDSRYLLLIADYVKVIDMSNPSNSFLFKGHGDFSSWSWNPKRVTCLAFFPDGKKVVTGGSRGFIKIWELSTGAEIMTFKAHDREVDSIKISPDGKIIAAGLDDNIKIWDSTTGNEIMTFKTNEKRVNSIVFSPDGKIIATGSGPTIRIWDLTTGTELYHMISEMLEFSADGIRKECLFKFSPDGKLFAVNRGTHVELWGINQKREEVKKYTQGIFNGLADVFLLPIFNNKLGASIQPSLDFSKDGQILSATFGSIVVYDINNRKSLRSYNNNNYNQILLKYAVLHPNGKLLIIHPDKGFSLVKLKQ